MASPGDPLFSSVAVYAALVAQCERDPRRASGARLDEAHAYWREQLRRPDAAALRAQYHEAYRRARWGDAPHDVAPSVHPSAPIDAPPPQPQPPPPPQPPSGFARCLARGDAIVAEALAFRDRCKGRQP